ncbi:MAG: hypothetical protein HQL87_11895 [Magnetococcales bacterium]|nr:hypothetical protein [Magnetococcales bacterium]
MNKAARLVALMAAAGFCMTTAAYATDTAPAKIKDDCKSDKKCEEQQKAAAEKAAATKK